MNMSSLILRVPTSINRNFQVLFCRFSNIYISPKRVTARGFPPLVVDWLKDPWDPSLQGERDLQELAGRSHPKVRGPTTFRGV